MKKVNLFLLGLTVVGVTFFTSCGEEEASAPPVITIDQASPVTASAGSVTLTGEIVAEGKLDQVKLFIVTGDAETQYGSAYTSFKAGDITTTDDMNYIFRFDVDGLTESCSVKIEATDKENQTSSKSVQVTVATGAAIDEFTAILMGAQGSTTGSALDVHTGTVYKLAEATAANIDILYYYGSTNKATLVAPNDATVNGGSGDFSWTAGWGTQNPTKFGMSSLSASAFDAMDDDTELAAISGLSASKVTDLGVDDVVEFITADGKKGALKVTALTAASDGTITINVKIQQ
jgi:hypothetical protein